MAMLTTYTYNTRNIIKNDSKKRQFYNDNSKEEAATGTIGGELNSESKLIEGQSVQSPPFLESQLKGARELLVEYLKAAENNYSEASQQYFEAERKITDTLSSLHDKREKLFPDSLYVVAGTLAGSIFARRRNILVRATLPIAFGLVSFKYFLPSTFENTFGFIWSLEQKNAPALAETQIQLVQKTDDLLRETEKLTNDSTDSILGAIQKSKKYIAEMTGLNIDQEISEKKK
ncbi:hypothetical protein BVG19_g83 [[Candida] boidinii]|nr:hypothetical protein BVG19_g83 [[Candida] boidinii]OWB49651.1 hypothetical protein B5S27_g1193 [[Candida] boidinii]OWB69795.1 hypothetical protein B5S30_g5228 [[Candida] boidinii]OWB84023.1 hypothetical protein B5S33_g2660 [[Candida] boidinii]